MGLTSLVERGVGCLCRRDRYQAGIGIAISFVCWFAKTGLDLARMRVLVDLLSVELGVFIVKA